ncbi:MAG: protein kinase [Myxococcota bacterium]|jgi:serine/threonine-protein kinase|nr:protein kinase [Myxococcota bacterium]
MSGYELLGEIARGGMARVLLCRRVGAAGFERYLAMKVIHDHLADEEEFVSMLLDEANVASRISHPNVVSVQDVGRTAQGAYYLIMEYVEGASLHRLLKLAGDAAPFGVVVALLVDALEGLHAAHSVCDEEGQPLGIVHRDVSPQNVLVGLDGVARIADFGIAKASSRITSTRPGMLKGRIRYMAPEQLLRDEVTARSDVYSAAVVAFGALAGEPLVSPSADAAAMYKVLSHEAPPVSSRGRRPPEAFDAPLARALRKDASERTATAAQLATELREAAEASGLSCDRSEVVAWVERWIGEEVRERRRKMRARKAVPLGTDTGCVSLPSGSVSLVDGMPPGDRGSSDVTLAAVDAHEATPTTRRHRLVLVAAVGALGAALWTRVLVGSHEPPDPEPPRAARFDARPEARPAAAAEERASEARAGALSAELTMWSGGETRPDEPPSLLPHGPALTSSQARPPSTPQARPARRSPSLASPQAVGRGAPLAPLTSPQATAPTWDVERLPLYDTSLPLRGAFDEASAEGGR